MKEVLVLTHGRDDCAPMVINHIKKMGGECTRFNTEEFQKTVKITLDLSKSGELMGRYYFPEKIVDFEDIGVVWNRRVHEPDAGNEFDDLELKNWALEESKWTMNISFTLIQAPIVNPWEINERLKFNKWLQMKRATELGLEIPDSRLTNNLADIRTFWEQTDRQMIFKKIRKGLFQMDDGKTLLVHTNKIPEEALTDNNIQRMRFCPMFFQHHIPKKYDIRSIVVGEKVFSVAIHSQNTPEGIVDYRTAAVFGKLHEMKHEQIDLGSTINQTLINYTKSFGLSFGAIDLILTPDDHLIFLEDNPNGQWAWLEHKTSAPISKAFAEHLLFLINK